MYEDEAKGTCHAYIKPHWKEKNTQNWVAGSVFIISFSEFSYTKGKIKVNKMRSVFAKISISTTKIFVYFQSFLAHNTY